MTSTIRVFLVDDHDVVRHGLRALVQEEPDIEVVGEAGTAGMAIAELARLEVDVAVLDVRLPDGSGVEVCREARSRRPELTCLMLTSHADDEALFAAIMAGAAGYLLKEVRGQDLVAAIRRVASGESLIDPALTGRVLERLRHGDAEDPRIAALTEQERRILEHIAEGRTNRQIAGEVNLAEKTIKNYVSQILAKLQMQRRTEAAVFWSQHRPDAE